MVEIKQRFAPKTNDNRPGLPMDPEYITIHTTRNLNKGADAEMHNRFVYNGGGQYEVSFHFAVDDREIWQNLPLNENGWHGGDGYHGTGNRKSIGIEICENSDGDFEKAVTNAIELTAKLMKQFKIPLEKVVTHKHWSGKNCPRMLLSRWEEIVNRIAKAAAEPKPSQTQKDPQPLPAGRTYKIQSGDTYWAIARKFGLKVADLQAANPGVDPTELKVGQVVNLEVNRPTVYVIKPGDTLWGIAAAHKGITVGDLMKANPGIDPKELKVGQTIQMIRPKSPAPTAAPKTSPVKKAVEAVKTVVKRNPYPLPTKTLKRGDRGADVRMLQTALNAAYFKVGAVDGVYGAKTENAVKRFQSMFYGVKDDGIFGSVTRAKLDEKLKKMYA